MKNKYTDIDLNGYDILTVELGERSYDIIVGKKIAGKIRQLN